MALYDMTPAQIMEELRKELAVNERIRGLLIATAEHKELSLYRLSARASGLEALVGLTSSAHAVIDFVNSITAGPSSPNKKVDNVKR